MHPIAAKATGPCVILAGAGTGKTYTIVQKVTHLINQGLYAPEQIVCLTFSNEAVESLRRRVTSVLAQDQLPLIRTFHSFCSDLLRAHAEKVGLRTDFKILVPDDAKIMLHKSFKLHPQLCHRYVETLGIAKDLGITIASLQAYLDTKQKVYTLPSFERAASELQFELNTSYLRASGGRQEQAAKKEKLKEFNGIVRLQKFIQTWRAYEKLKEKRNCLDYADLHQKAIVLFEKFPDLAHNYSYVIVDEFQDTNKMQGDLLVHLCPHKNITIVGDLNQSIYRFRGAYRENFSNFKKAFAVTPEDILSLDKSYRSTNNILRVAHLLIEKNYKNKAECFPVTSASDVEGLPVQVLELVNEKEEVRAIVERIKKEHETRAYEEIAVLFRTHQQAARLKKSLQEQEIPYVAVTKNALFATPTIKKLVDYLVLGHAYATKRAGQQRAWWELLHLNGLEPEELAAVGRALKKHGEDACLSETLFSLLPLPTFSEPSKVRIEQVKAVIRMLADEVTKPLKEISGKAIAFLIEEESSPEARTNLEKCKELIETFTQQESDKLDDFLYHIEVMQKLGIDVEAPAIEQRGVRIMTHHATKGLEYECVICTHLVQNKFPSERMQSSGLIPSECMPDLAEQLASTPEYLHEDLIEEYEREQQLAEERRLAYVAFTRAKQTLLLTYAQTYGAKSYVPSQFLQDINYKQNADVMYVQDLAEHQDSGPHIETALQASLPQTKKMTFSPSALLLFQDCQKKYEYKYLYHMPEKEPTSWEEILLGSFVHEIIEQGVKAHFTNESMFIEAARTRSVEPGWQSVNVDEAIALLKIFFQRNKHKYNPSSKTEIKLRTVLEGITFEGYADRIDVTPAGLEIIDYKTGRTPIAPQHRNWQLGFYALAADHMGLGTVRRVTLDMLRFEKPIEFELLQDGTAREIHSKRLSFTIDEVKKELVETAQRIIGCYEKGFAPCSPEKNCEFCNEFMWKTT